MQIKARVFIDTRLISWKACSFLFSSEGLGDILGKSRVPKSNLFDTNQIDEIIRECHFS